MIFLNGVISPPCSILIATTSITSVERKKVERVVKEGGSCALVDRSGTAPDVPGVPLIDQMPPDFSMLQEAVDDEEAMRQVENEAMKTDDESEIVSVGGPLSIVARCESEGNTFEEAIGKAGLVPGETLFWTRLVYESTMLVFKRLITSDF